MLRLRHTVRLGRDVVALASVNRVWWAVPLVALLIVTTVLVATAQAVVPYAMYTLF